MDFDLRTYPSVEVLAQQVERVTAKPVLITLEPGLGTMLSTQVTARHEAQPAHLVRINEKHHGIRHVLASYQMRLILRRFEIRAKEKDVSLSASAIGILTDELRNSEGIPSEKIPALAQHLAGGLVTQLRSVLPSVVAHRDIQKFQPELQEQQVQAISGSINDNLQSLGQSPFSKKLVQWNRQMACVESYGLAKIARDESHLIPFEALGLTESAKALVVPLLLGEWGELDDRELVEKTAKHIGMTELHQWI